MAEYSEEALRRFMTALGEAAKASGVTITITDKKEADEVVAHSAEAADDPADCFIFIVVE